MSGKERDSEMEPGLEQVAKRRKTENTSSLVCGDADRNDSKSKEDSCVDNDKESMCESDVKGDSKLVHPDEDSRVRRDIVPGASKRSNQVICGSGGDRLTIVDTSLDTVVTMKSISGILGKDDQVDGNRLTIIDNSKSDQVICASGGDRPTILDTSRDTVATMKSVSEILGTMKFVSEILGKDDQVDGDDVSRDIGSSSADQSSCIVSEQMHLESPSTNNLSNQISEQKQDTIMKDENDAQTNLVETNEDDKEKKPQISMGIDVRRKLLVLDINGLLADVVSISYVPDDYKADIVIGMKAVFKRPHCDDFLQFCFERFNVGIWSSRTKRNVDSILELLMGEHRSKLVFCWDQSHCTRTGFNTIDNQNKPLVLKELNKLWEKDDPSLPWNIGDYNESNTLLLDDSPYKGLKNPPNTAIFPDTYQYKNLNDDSLGPKGDLRSYLEELSLAPNVQKYVELNSHGQRPITESNPLWHFYAKVIGNDSTKQEESSSHSEIRHEEATTTDWVSVKIMKDQSFTKDINFAEYRERHSQWDKLPINKNEQHSNWDSWSKLTVGRSLESIACSSNSNWDKLIVNRSLEAIACSSMKPFERGRNICEMEKASSDPRGHHPHTQPIEQNTQSTTKDSVHLSSKTNQQWGCRAGTTIEARSPCIQRFSFGRNRDVFRKKKLLILDVNGVLADFVSYEPPECRADSWLGDRAVFKRPYCDDFLNFCFDKFHIGFWLTTSRRNARSNLDFFLGTAAKNVLFSWDVSHCLGTDFFSLEKTQRRDAHILLKELRKIWESDDPNLKWGKDRFNHSNTLLVDNYPHTALLNPPHTAIFPPRYRYKDEPTDDTLGPEGDLRVFLEGLAYAEDVQEYVKNNPFGQAPISDKNPSWKYYSRVIEDTKARQKPWLERWWTPTNEHNSSLDKLKVDQNVVLTERSLVKPFENRNNYEDGIAISGTRGHNPTTQTDEQKRQSRTKDLVHLSYNKDQQQDCSTGVTVVTSREPPAPWIPHSSLGNNQELSRKTKLLILDVNGLLADFVSFEPDSYKADSFLGNKAVFKRPYCDDFLNFCFEKFNIGFWLTTSKRNTRCNLDFLLGRLTKDVLFSWDISYCSETNFGTFERRDRRIFFKDLRRVWEDDQQYLPWGRGRFDPSNTLLVDNYPTTALLNPPHTAIFPPRFWYKDVKTDNSLGPGGDLRVFLEGLALADNVQDYVGNNPFGQTPISEETPSWNYYARVVDVVKARQKAWSVRWWTPTNAHQRTC